MGRGGGQNVDIRISAQDRASPVIRGVGQEFKRLPEGFSKAAAAMTVLEGASGSMGGAFAQAAGKASGLLSLVASGGPLGIGIAAVTAAVGAGTLAWKMYKQDADQAKEASAAVAAVLAARAADVTKFGVEVEKAAEALRTMGWTSEQKFAEQAEKAERGLANTMSSRNKLLAEREKLERSVGMYTRDKVKLEKQAADAARLEEVKEALATEEEVIKTTRTKIDSLKEMAAIQGELAFAEKDAREQERAAAEDKKKWADADRAAAADRKRREEEGNAAANAHLDHLLRMDAERVASRKATAASIAAVEATINQVGLDFDKKAAEWRRSADERMLAAEEKKYQQIAQFSSQVIGIVGRNFEAVAAGQKSIGDAARDSVLQVAEASIMAAAAQAAAQQLAAHSFLPFVGLVVGGAAASAIFGAVRAYLSQMPKAAEGYRVTGGTPGVDSVPVMAQQGERILSKRQTNAFERMVAIAERGGQAGSSMTVVFNSVVPSTSAEATRNIRALGKRQKALARRRI